jgi:catechol 2,3-dioxygenase-like lactoylglutathione lyase family enzyme
VQESLTFYTGVLDFEKKYPGQSDADWVIDLVRGDAEIQLSQHAGDGAFGCAVNIRLIDVDGLFRKFVERGLDASARRDSPVHCGPMDQTWGVREFYVTDADGNTLRFGEVIR